MLPGYRRIRRGEFSTDGKPAVFWRGAILCAARVPSKEKSTFAVVVGKKYAKNAVARNRFRRHLYTLIAAHLPEFDQYGKWKYIFYPAKNITEVPKEDLKTEIRRILKKLHTPNQLTQREEHTKTP